MRPLVFAAVLLVPAGEMRAQTHLLDPIEIIDPGLSASVVPSTPAFGCSDANLCGFEQAVICSTGQDLTAPVAADGTLYFFERIAGLGCDGQAYGAYHRLMRVRPGGGEEEVLRLHGGRCLECSGSTCTRYEYGPDRTSYDVTHGVLFVRAYFQLVDSGGVNVMPPEYGLVRVSGFPAMRNTLMTYLPGGLIATLMPAHPDGVPFASLACWAGFGCIRVLARDRDGKPIDDAQVTLTKEGEGTVGVARTSDDGSALFGDLEPAQDYTITVASPGLSTTSLLEVRVDAGRTTSVPITLRPAEELRERFFR